MTVLFFNFKGFIFFTLVLIFPFLKFQPGTKLNKDILLQNELLTIMPKEFYVADVVDARENRTSIAWLVPVAGPKIDQRKLVPVDLQGGGLSSIKQFIDKNLPCNKSLRPVVVTLKKFKVIETVAAGKLVEGHIELKLSFELKNYNGNLHLADYNGSAVYSRTIGLPQEIEPTLRHVLVSGLVYLNTWMNSQAGNSIKLAKAVNVVFTNYTEKQEGDTIYYSLKRPLTWADFQSEISNSRYDAQVFPTFGYEEHNEIKKGIIIIRLSIKVCLPKSACWVKENSRNDTHLTTNKGILILPN